MWFSFCITLLVELIVAATPGLVFLAALEVPLFIALAGAVPATTFLFGVAGVIGDVFGLYGIVWLLAISLIIAVFIVFIWRVALPKLRNAECSRALPYFEKTDLFTISLYLVVGFLFFAILYLKNIDGAASFIQFNDNHSHLAWIKRIAETGNFSTLNVSFYDSDSLAAPYSGGQFYPIGFHIIAAIGMSLSGASAPVAENAAAAVFVGFAYAMSIGAMLAKVLSFNRRVVMLGLVGMMANVAYPLRMFAVHGPFPNIAGFACAPAMLLMFVELVDVKEECLYFEKSSFAPFITVSGGVAILHPNAFIFAAMWIATYWIIRIVPLLGERFHPFGLSKKLSQFAFGGLSALVIISVWIALGRSSFMQSIVSFIWYWSSPVSRSLGNLLDGGLLLEIPLAAWGALVLLGFWRAIRQREITWLAVFYAVLCVQYVVTGIGDEGLKSLVSGFWYTDPERLVAMIAIAAVPLFCLGFDFVISTTQEVLVTSKERHAFRFSANGFVTVLLVASFIGMNYSPVYLDSNNPPTDVTAFAQTFYELENRYSIGTAPTYTSAERQFVRKVMEYLPEGETVLNVPFDGSTYAYSSDDLAVYYRGNGGSDETWQSAAIRSRLYDISEDEEVAAAVESVGVNYVLLLDMSEYEMREGETSSFMVSENFEFPYNSWKGILELDDDTPGFELILSEGTMRLYKITG